MQPVIDMSACSMVNLFNVRKTNHTLGILSGWLLCYFLKSYSYGLLSLVICMIVAGFMGGESQLNHGRVAFTSITAHSEPQSIRIVVHHTIWWFITPRIDNILG